MDSVFTPLLYASPFEDDKPLISEKSIQRGLDDIENRSVTAQERLFDNAIGKIMDQAAPLIERQDMAGIVALDWNLKLKLQAPIFQLWDLGVGLGAIDGLEEMRMALPEEYRYDISPLFKQLIQQLSNLAPISLKNTATEQAILQRVIQLAGNFSDSVINSVKQSLIRSVVPQADTGNPISRKELLGELQNTLDVAKARAQNIARTETTAAYNTARVGSYNQSDLVTAVRFLAILDTRTTEICTSRNGMVISKSDAAAIAMNKPPLHYQCFPAGTLITMADGEQRPIELVEIGQRVQTTTTVNVQKVYNIIRTRFTGFLHKITLENGITVKSTPEHPFWDGRDFVSAASITPGLSLYSPRSIFGVKKVRVSPVLGGRESSIFGILVSSNPDTSDSIGKKHWDAIKTTKQGFLAGWDSSVKEGQDPPQQLGEILGANAHNRRLLRKSSDGQWINCQAGWDSEMDRSGLASTIGHPASREIGGGSLSVATRQRGETAAGIYPRKEYNAPWEYGTPWTGGCSGIAKDEIEQSFSQSGCNKKNAGDEESKGSRFFWGAQPVLWQDWQREQALLSTRLQGRSGKYVFPLNMGSECSQNSQPSRADLGTRAESFPNSRGVDLSPGLLSPQTESMDRGQGVLDRRCKEEIRFIPSNLSRTEDSSDLRTEVSVSEEIFQGLAPLRVIAVELVPFDGWVYNLSVENDEVYLANGILVHNCRSVLSPLMPDVNPLHQKMVNDPARQYQNRDLVPLLPGWRQ